jgi:hypothetical protein
MAIARSEQAESKIVADLVDLVKTRWPDTKFQIGAMPEGEGTGIWAYSEADFLEMCAAVADREFEAMEKHHVMVYVIPMPLEAWEG